MANPKPTGTPADPTGLKSDRKRADAIIRKRLQLAAKRIKDLLPNIPHTIEQVDDADAPKAYKSEKRKADLVANAQTYTWLISDALMDQTASVIRQILADALLSGDTSWQQRWWMNAFLDPACEKGTSDSLIAAQAITAGLDVQSAQTISLMDAEQQLTSPQYLNRLQLMHGRVFEEMAGLTDSMVVDLRRTLTEGMGRGLGIRDLTGMIYNRVGVGMARAQRIARTETNKAYTDAYMAETEDLNANLKEDDYSIRLMHVSALTETTRASHAARHGKLYTKAQQQTWWRSGGHSINCYCSTTAVLINLKTGEILQQGLVDRTRARGEAYFATHGIKA